MLLELPDSGYQRFICDMDVAIHGSLDTGISQKFLKGLGLQTRLDAACGIGVPECVHAELCDTVFITDFLDVCVVAAVLCRHVCAEVQKHQLRHSKLPLGTCAPMYLSCSDRDRDCLRNSFVAWTALRMS